MHGAPIYVRHEIVHNTYVVNDLKAKGAIFIEDLAEVPAGATLVFSAHGVSKAVRDEAARHGEYAVERQPQHRRARMHQRLAKIDQMGAHPSASRLPQGGRADQVGPARSEFAGPCADPAPRMALDPDVGFAAFGRTAKDVRIVEDLYEHTISVILRAEALGGWQALESKHIFDIEYWDLEQAKLRKGGKEPIYTGEIAVVTGAASVAGALPTLKTNGTNVRCSCDFMKYGSIDIVIGTHALLSKSIKFKKLGLVIVDEEQHFGVAHKEKLKALKEDVHVLRDSPGEGMRGVRLGAKNGARNVVLVASEALRPSRRALDQVVLGQHHDQVLHPHRVGHRVAVGRVVDAPLVGRDPGLAALLFDTRATDIGGHDLQVADVRRARQ